MRRIYDLITTLVRINQLRLEKGFRDRIIATWLKVFFLGRYDSKNGTANIAGLNVKFINFRLFSFLFHEIFTNNEYCFVSERNDPYIIDCGSNIGMSVLYFKMLYPDARIVAFEPGEEAYRCLNENVTNNQLKSVTMHQAALSNEEGTIDFYYDPDNVGALAMSVKQERMPKQKRSVKAMLLSKYINEDVDFLKIDIEGAELEVIEELYKAEKLKYVKQMVIEYHHHISKDADMFSKFLRILENAGLGYQIQGYLERPLVRERFQDIFVYAYRKESAGQPNA